jgi:hypothetical protein
VEADLLPNLKIRIAVCPLRYRAVGTTRNRLKASAKELLALQKHLKEARRREGIPIAELVESGRQIPFPISDIDLEKQ